ncbi:hypothetical protein [Parapedobacter indicus]|uniref:Helix-turn-helix domain of resolvase n=1 Tax=Parapedobacter indicus TaxID=1477437 RepID=A0A1I3TG73_9SPHI|nr:hypothetical protein [Parapedobacter indicus]PPK99512.1 hypothetical protein CLV26_11230 [Parapedobacter indicus]SFJ69493.1 hypothetical protein SAMN05444682_112151 [Parapedobacter indicus]
MMAYNASIQAKWDWQNAVSLAEERATERERAKAAKLLEKERAEAEKIQSVKKMLARGLSITDAAEFSGLSIKKVTKIQTQQADLTGKKK